jgi:hypothetical protein
MAVHIYYQEDQYLDPTEGMAGIRERIHDGWQISQIRGPVDGPFAVMFQREHASPVRHDDRRTCRR